MGLHLKRNKERSFLLTIIYRLSKFLPFGKEKRLRFFLDLEWIFDRLSMEASFAYFEPNLHPARKYSHQYMLKHIDENTSVLDFGCKFGEISFFLAHHAKKVVAIDYDQSAIDIAKKERAKENIEYLCEDAFQYLQNIPEKFDTLILSHIVEHIDQPENLLNQCKPYCEKIYIEVPDFDKIYLNHYRKEVGTKLNYTDGDHVWEFDRDELESLITDKCGMSILESEYRYGVLKLWCKT